MAEKKPIDYCYLIRNSQPCVKAQISKKHLPYYECELCIWRIHSDNPRHLKTLQRIYEKYHPNV